MAGTLAAYTYAVDDTAAVHWFKPGDTPPAWALPQLSNPKVWQDGDVPSADESTDTPPPKGGPGSGVDKWIAYAESKGVTLTDEQRKSREDVMAALDAASVPTE
jgi:hypothetical protein